MLRSVLSLLAMLSVPAFATVQILSMTPSVASPQVLGTPVTWTVTAHDSHPNQLTFQFNVAAPGTSGFALARDFNVGTLASGIWTSQAFVWVPTGLEGTYQVQVIAKDFTSGETATQTSQFSVTPLVTGSTPVAVKTANPLVALFSAPSCAAGSAMRVVFQVQSKTKPATRTGWSNCHPPATMTFEIAGMYPSTAYYMLAQTMTAGTITNGPPAGFTTGALPETIPFPPFTINVASGPGTDTAASMLLLNPTRSGNGPIYPNVATDLSGNILWYYYPSPPQDIILTRPLPTYSMLTIQSGAAWNPRTTLLRLLSQKCN